MDTGAGLRRFLSFLGQIDRMRLLTVGLALLALTTVPMLQCAKDQHDKQAHIAAARRAEEHRQAAIVAEAQLAEDRKWAEEQRAEQERVTQEAEAKEHRASVLREVARLLKDRGQENAAWRRNYLIENKGSVTDAATVAKVDKEIARLKPLAAREKAKQERALAKQAETDRRIAAMPSDQELEILTINAVRAAYPGCDMDMFTLETWKDPGGKGCTGSIDFRITNAFNARAHYRAVIGFNYNATKITMANKELIGYE